MLCASSCPCMSASRPLGAPLVVPVAEPAATACCSRLSLALASASRRASSQLRVGEWPGLVLRIDGCDGVVDCDGSTSMCASSLARRPAPRGAAAAALLVVDDEGRPWLKLLLRTSLTLVERVRLTGPYDDDLAAAEPLMMSDERAATCSMRCSPKRSDGSIVALQSGNDDRLVSNASSGCMGDGAEVNGRARDDEARGEGVEMGALGGVGRSYRVGDALWVVVPLEQDDDEVDEVEPNAKPLVAAGEPASAYGSDRARSLDEMNMAVRHEVVAARGGAQRVQAALDVGETKQSTSEVEREDRSTSSVLCFGQASSFAGEEASPTFERSRRSARPARVRTTWTKHLASGSVVLLGPTACSSSHSSSSTS
ncbi:uncharacterized protein RHOBADRAFT_49337 [Rhodotorula graminis WP1]|uniref:Uncharacterized protein n=1 Tax=Rhodotorula graminis (strain WP1) TaxID=578459 RepID=A0A194SBH6_RHOGW|nr:uncharacterized protein RHOBADRAFT_49337 [Rhodotorula graminis WP1]KPV76761.1 hypothetical protein RHOBADRAFT_49337 [Rhodotorula graminis WP1]